MKFSCVLSTLALSFVSSYYKIFGKFKDRGIFTIPSVVHGKFENADARFRNIHKCL